MSDYLYLINRSYDVKIFAFVLMQNHFHLLIKTPQANLDKAMGVFMRETSRWLTYNSSRINLTYSQRHFRSIVHSPLYFLHAYKYIYRNPVKAGVCQRVEEYPFSTLYGLLGQTHQWIPLEPDETLFNDPPEVLRWLNQAPSEEDWNAIRGALRRGQFTLRRDTNTNKQHHLENDML